MVTVLIRLICIPVLVFVGLKDLWDRQLFLRLDGVPPMAAMTGLSIFNINFMLKRRKMFNYSHTA